MKLIFLDGTKYKNMKNISSFTVAVVVLLFASIFVFFPYTVLNGKSFLGFTIEVTKYNELGDFIGGITAPVLSVFAIYLLYLTYQNQRKELHETRKILVDQNKTLSTQQFETTYFNMLNLHHQIINTIEFESSLDLEYADRTYNIKSTFFKGRSSFREFYLIYLHYYRNRSADEGKTPSKSIIYDPIREKRIISNAFGDFYIENEMHLGHYIRNIESLITFVDDSILIDKIIYLKLFRSQLSTYELNLIFYFCLWSEDSNIKNLVVKHKLLKNINQHHLNKMEDIQLIEKEAYS